MRGNTESKSSLCSHYTYYSGISLQQGNSDKIRSELVVLARLLDQHRQAADLDCQVSQRDQVPYELM
jgi:hypothetical protein